MNIKWTQAPYSLLPKALFLHLIPRRLMQIVVCCRFFLIPLVPAHIMDESQLVKAFIHLRTSWLLLVWGYYE